MAVQLKTAVSSAFRMNGLTLRSDASKYLLEVLLPFSEEEREDAVQRLIEAVQKQPLESTMIDRRLCEQAVIECNKDEEDDKDDQIFTVISAFDVPKFSYQHDRKKFLPARSVGLPEPRMIPPPEVKTKMNIDRYHLLHQRTLRHELFSAPVLGAPSEDTKKFQLQPIEFLQGDQEGQLVVLGMLSQIKEGKWHLEDPTGAVELNLKEATFHNGLFTEGCFVLVEGTYTDGVFSVKACGFPPSETAKASREYFGNVNFFGGSSQTCVASSERLKKLELEHSDALLVFLSDVSLDSPKVFDRLRRMFDGFSSVPPVAFVFCGNFTSQPHGFKLPNVVKDGLTTLGSLIAEFPSLVRHSKFVFVPGRNDPGLSDILPRPALPEVVRSGLLRRVPEAIFATNPCRIQYCTQEIVVCRDELGAKLCRNCLKFPSDSDIPAHLSKTVVCQATLSPLPLHVTPVHWDFSHALTVYPLPDVVVCAESSDQFVNEDTACIVANPGSFSRTDFRFHVYYPQSRQMEGSRIAD